MWNNRPHLGYNGRQLVAVVVLILVLVSSCHNASTDKSTTISTDTTKASQPATSLIEGKDTFIRVIDTFAIGDINGDGKEDTAYVTGPFFNQEKQACKDSCQSSIRFSSGIPSLQLGPSIGGTVYAQTDVTDDGRCEILFVPDWFQSCWSGMSIYSFRGNAWVRLGEASVYSCADSVSYNRVRKAGKGHIEYRNDEWDDDGNMTAKWHKVDLK